MLRALYLIGQVYSKYGTQLDAVELWAEFVAPIRIWLIRPMFWICSVWHIKNVLEHLLKRTSGCGLPKHMSWVGC